MPVDTRSAVNYRAVGSRQHAVAEAATSVLLYSPDNCPSLAHVFSEPLLRLETTPGESTPAHEGDQDYSPGFLRKHLQRGRRL